MTTAADPVVVIGAGPAGLSAAHALVQVGRPIIVLEMADTVGGIARTVSYKGYHFDIGGHRFFTKIDRVNAIWQQMLGDDFRSVSRLSRIYYRDQFFNYPLRVGNALRNLGMAESVVIMLSYLQAMVSPSGDEESFEGWVSNRFGKRLYETFFKTYTEKTWGIPCHKIHADWAAQRIKGLSLFNAVANALFGFQRAKSLIDSFHYPLQGPGMMWRRFHEHIEAHSGEVRFGAEVTRIVLSDRRVAQVVCADGAEISIDTNGAVISTMPLVHLVRHIDPAPPEAVTAAAERLGFRSFLIVGLILDRAELFPDQWIYIHSPDVRVGRIQNFKNWSTGMVPDQSTSSVGMEYFCDEGDALWSLSDDELEALARAEIEQLGLARADEVTDSIVVRQANAYPVYSRSYAQNLQLIRDYIDSIENLHTIGRAGMHRYNNMDHSMYTGILAAENVEGARHDLWSVNDEEEYLEEQPLPEAAWALSSTFARMDKLAFATALGTVCGLMMFLATAWLVIRGGPVVGPNLALLSEYFVGYTVTMQGAMIAFGYSFMWGFLLGWFFAYLRNFSLALFAYRARRRAQLLTLRDFIDQF